MKRTVELIILLCMSLLTIKGQPVTINGITYDYYAPYKFINGKKVIISESALVKSASTSLSGSITIPSQITYKGKSVVVTAILRNAFEDCSQITSIIVPAGVGSIGDYAFKNCTGLRSIKLPVKIDEIGCGAFYNCCSLISVELPTLIQAYAGFHKVNSELFYGCSSLIYVKIPSGATAVESSSFYGCTSLTDIFCYPTKVPYLAGNAFDKTNRRNIKVHVPNTVLSQYRSSNWNQFRSIDSDMTRPQIKKQSTNNVNFNTRTAIDMGGTVEWANMNIEASSPQETGGLFAWGETRSKNEFSPRNYSAPKFPGWAGYEIYDNGLKGTNYDAARMKWGGGWRMPTENEFKELIFNCKQIKHPREHYVEFIAPNGNRLILPYFESTNITYNGIGNFYWTLNTDSRAPLCCEFRESGFDISGRNAISSSSEQSRTSYFTINNMGGHYGGLIRPVRDKKKKTTRTTQLTEEELNNINSLSTSEEMLKALNYASDLSSSAQKTHVKSEKSSLYKKAYKIYRGLETNPNRHKVFSDLSLIKDRKESVANELKRLGVALEDD